jgi:3'-phosphoadenosine 5'-phosphosulfate sulfotransferase (PAPS reductase)/FAD synthetase
MQFCTTILKVEPTQEWLGRVDPDGDLIVVVGVRREESDKRAAWPEWIEQSALDGAPEVPRELLGLGELVEQLVCMGHLSTP